MSKLVDRQEKRDAFHVAQLRHAYSHLVAERVTKQREFADGLIAPAIRHFEQAASRIERLESALREIADGGPNRKVAVPYFPDKPSKHDKCEHGLAMWEDCGECTAAFARSALSQEETR